MMIITYTDTKNTVILPKTKVKKKTNLKCQPSYWKKKKKGKLKATLERNQIEENRKNADERVKFLQGPFKFPLTDFSGL